MEKHFRCSFFALNKLLRSKISLKLSKHSQMNDVPKSNISAAMNNLCLVIGNN